MMKVSAKKPLSTMGTATSYHLRRNQMPSNPLVIVTATAAATTLSHCARERGGGGTRARDEATARAQCGNRRSGGSGGAWNAKSEIVSSTSRRASDSCRWMSSPHTGTPAKMSRLATMTITCDRAAIAGGWRSATH